MFGTGKISTFGGPADLGVAPEEGLALINPRDLSDPWFGDLFLKSQPRGTSGLARRLDPTKFYCACRWKYEKFPKELLRNSFLRVTFKGKSALARPVDWGPNLRTKRLIDVSPGLLAWLGAKTDDEVEIELNVLQRAL